MKQQPIILVFDTALKKRATEMPMLRKYLNSKDVTTVYWRSESVCPMSSYPSALKFDYTINGHVDGYKNYTHLRRSLKHKPQLLAQPCILIDGHAHSLQAGGFDYTINTRDTEVRNFLAAGLDVERILHSICTYQKNWYTDNIQTQKPPATTTTTTPTTKKGVYKAVR